ncbi:UBX domain-containing protein [Trichophyton equinum CBS 127.97]|uniref:UBX domain-containing protein n=1 Tax=Trichophyton equinum (strain ATCC MYA-4606 / CBS 127.97) TaxID=559882 RepID=F2Q5Z0_TRIEC|nr:UBX domain-containing protein [Trichophyton equinum CBS 127.97]
MFYQGDLQSGINEAVREVKQVVCFITDDGQLSNLWENNYLRDERIVRLITTNAVALRLIEGSQEAEFLSTFCPVNESPTLIVIKNGIVREYIAARTEEPMFKRRLIAALEDNKPPRRMREAMARAQAQAQRTANQTAGSPSVSPTTVPSAPTASGTPVSTPPAPSPAPATPAPPSNVVDPPSDTRGNDQQRRDSVREGKRPAEPDNEKKEQAEWKGKQKRRHQQESEERERVLERIRRDNEERKAKAERQRAAAAEKHEASRTTPPASQKYRLQVRLFDGSSIRNTFSPNQTIGTAVRSWLDRERSDGDAPYTLKHILTPLENKTISLSEEDQSLQELGVGPTATLVMVPIRTYTDAYSDSGASLPYRVLSGGYNLVAGTVNAVAGVVGSALGIGQNPAAVGRGASTQTEATEETSTTSSRMSTRNRVRTLHDANSGENDHQFYNGNQLNFEPRKKDDDN